MNVPGRRIKFTEGKARITGEVTRFMCMEKRHFSLKDPMMTLIENDSGTIAQQVEGAKWLINFALSGRIVNKSSDRQVQVWHFVDLTSDIELTWLVSKNDSASILRLVREPGEIIVLVDRNDGGNTVLCIPQTLNQRVACVRKVS